MIPTAVRIGELRRGAALGPIPAPPVGRNSPHPARRGASRVVAFPLVRASRQGRVARFVLVLFCMGAIRSILVVDDDASMRDMVVSMLREQGIEAIAAESVDAAMDALRGHAFDVVLTDMQMPGKNGLQLLREARALEPRTLVIVMTSFGSAEVFERVRLAGAIGCLSKPFSREELQSALAGAGDLGLGPGHHA